MTGRACSAGAATGETTAAMTGATGAMTGKTTGATGAMTGKTVVAAGPGCSGNRELDDQAARVLLISLLNAAPPACQPPVTRRLHRAERLGAGNFPLIGHEATGTARRPSSAADQASPAS